MQYHHREALDRKAVKEEGGKMKNYFAEKRSYSLVLPFRMVVPCAKHEAMPERTASGQKYRIRRHVSPFLLKRATQFPLPVFRAWAQIKGHRPDRNTNPTHSARCKFQALECVNCVQHLSFACSAPCLPD